MSKRWIAVAAVGLVVAGCQPANSPPAGGPATARTTPPAAARAIPSATATQESAPAVASAAATEAPAAVSALLPAVSASATPPDASVPKPPGCPADLPSAQAEADFQEAQQAIKKAGEHPSDADLQRILPKLRGAALSGHLGAQLRYGWYVVGYWMTDEMFWPRDKKTAVTALAMLRVAVRRGGGDAEWEGLGRDPVVLREPPVSMLPKAWIRLAVDEANAWERCHPGVVPAR